MEGQDPGYYINGLHHVRLKVRIPSTLSDKAMTSVLKRLRPVSAQTSTTHLKGQKGVSGEFRDRYRNRRGSKRLEQPADRLAQGSAMDLGVEVRVCGAC